MVAAFRDRRRARDTAAGIGAVVTIGLARGDTRKFVASARASNLHASEAVPASVGRILVTRAARLNAGSSVAVETPPFFRLAVVYAIGTLVYGVAVAVVEA